MDAPLESRIAHCGYAYLRNLIAAEAAVRRGEFTAAKVLRVAAYVQRTLAMNLLRLEPVPDIGDLLQTNLAEMQGLDQTLPAAEGTERATAAVYGQVHLNSQHLEAELLRALDSLEAHQEIRDADGAEILWVCLHCGFLMEGERPDTCRVCGAVAAEFAWFGPFYVENPERLGQLSVPEILATLENAPQEVAGITSGVPEEALLHRVSQEQWCVKEIVGHLIEIDRLFTRRVALILERDDVPEITSPGPPWKLQEGNGYAWLPIEELLQRWAQARSASLALVRDLTPEQWSRRGALREVTTSLIDLGVWLANHDLGHTAQIRRLCAGAGPSRDDP
ncbi:MAG TPA: DinB family protein [Chthonomonadaceae bacterium]|nr:DinB family protein [Chthonomonadaceae bacterium]